MVAIYSRSARMVGFLPTASRQRAGVGLYCRTCRFDVFPRHCMPAGDTNRGLRRGYVRLEASSPPTHRRWVSLKRRRTCVHDPSHQAAHRISAIPVPGSASQRDRGEPAASVATAPRVYSVCGGAPPSLAFTSARLGTARANHRTFRRCRCGAPPLRGCVRAPYGTRIRQTARNLALSPSSARCARCVPSRCRYGSLARSQLRHSGLCVARAPT